MLVPLVVGHAFQSPAAIGGLSGAVRASCGCCCCCCVPEPSCAVLWFLCCCRLLLLLLLPLPLSRETASWCVKRTKCLNNSVWQESISSAAVLAILRWLLFCDERLFAPLSIPTCRLGCSATWESAWALATLRAWVSGGLGGLPDCAQGDGV